LQYYPSQKKAVLYRNITISTKKIELPPQPLARLDVKGELKEITYFRLHGIGGEEVNYKYKYTDQDLQKLKSIVEKCLEKSKVVYVLFNNIYMLQDAQRFKQVISGKS